MRPSLSQSEPKSNGIKGVLHTFQCSRTGASLSDVVKYHTQDTSFQKGLIPLQEIQSAYTNPSQKEGHYILLSFVSKEYGQVGKF